MIYKIAIGLLLLATVLYYFFCFLQIFNVVRFTKNEVKIPQMFIPLYYLLKKEPVEENPKVKSRSKKKD
jgi:hypothetical protein